MKNVSGGVWNFLIACIFTLAWFGLSKLFGPVAASVLYATYWATTLTDILVWAIKGQKVGKGKVVE